MTHSTPASVPSEQPTDPPALAAPCPTCSGPMRETVGMVCQTCGTDYGPPVALLTMPLPTDARLFGVVLEAVDNWWQRDHDGAPLMMSHVLSTATEVKIFDRPWAE